MFQSYTRLHSWTAEFAGQDLLLFEPWRVGRLEAHLGHIEVTFSILGRKAGVASCLLLDYKIPNIYSSRILVLKRNSINIDLFRNIKWTS
jgi:hypothetical protein